MKKKKVLFISAGIFPIPANKGGAVEELIDVFLENNKKDDRYEVSVASCAYSGREIKSKIEGVNYFYFNCPLHVKIKDKIYYFYVEKILKDWRSMFRQNYYKGQNYVRQIIKKLDLGGYDVIVVENNMSLLKELARAMGEEFDKKCMYHMHSNLIDNEEMIPYLARCRKILAVSDYVKNLLYETVPQFADTEIVKVVNGIKITKYDDGQLQKIRAAMREKYSIGQDETVFLFCGRVSPEKGVLEMTRAYASVIPKLKKSKLIIVGSASSGSDKQNNYYKQIKSVAQKYPNEIIMTGYIDHKDVGKYHAMSDVLVVPSIMDDPAPLTVLEGMSAGMYLLASRVGGIPEYSKTYANKSFFERDENFEENIKTAFLKYYDEFAQSGYERRASYFDESEFYNALAEAIDV